MPDLGRVRQVEAQNVMLLSPTHGRCKLPGVYERFA